jgi:hypothetical protein
VKSRPSWPHGPSVWVVSPIFMLPADLDVVPPHLSSEEGLLILADRDGHLICSGGAIALRKSADVDSWAPTGSTPQTHEPVAEAEVDFADLW